MVFWDGVKKGAFWGLCLGISLSIIATLLDLFSNEAGVTDPTTVVIYVILLGIIGAVLGCTVALILEAIIGTLKFFNWLFIFMAGSLLTILTPKL
jgi:heme/copper-type cytochrome/quinol oxidase subunit 4